MIASSGCTAWDVIALTPDPIWSPAMAEKADAAVAEIEVRHTDTQTRRHTDNSRRHTGTDTQTH